MTVGSERDTYSYEPFTRHPFYETVNRALVEEGVRRLAPAPRGATVVDLSCGTGAMTLMVIEALRSRGVEASIVAAEPSSEALAEAERRLAGSGADVRFVQGGVTELAGALDGPVDALFFGNAIHLVPDLDRVVGEIAGLLAPGGVFAFNSAFFEGAYAAGHRAVLPALDAAGPAPAAPGASADPALARRADVRPGVALPGGLRGLPPAQRLRHRPLRPRPGAHGPRVVPGHRALLALHRGRAARRRRWPREPTRWPTGPPRPSRSSAWTTCPRHWLQVVGSRLAV